MSHESSQGSVPQQQPQVAAELAKKVEDQNLRSNHLWQLAELRCAENPEILAYIQHRVIEQADYFSKASTKAKRNYKRLTNISIICSAAIPVVTFLVEYCDFLRLLVIALGSAVTAISAWLASEKTKDNWLRTRQKRELLLGTCYSFLMDAGCFSDPQVTCMKEIRTVKTCADGAVEESIVTEKTFQSEEMTQKVREHMLVELCEQILQDENDEWFQQKNAK